VSQVPPSTDPELVARLCSGEREALAEAYDRFAPTVFRLGYHLLGDGDEAEDLVQEVFTGLPRAARTFEGRSSFVYWLRRVATRTALMMLRQRRIRGRGAQRFGWLTPRWSGAGAPAARMDLESALATLDDELRTVFMLHEVEGYSHDEIGEMLGLGASATRVRLHRARRRLRAYLEDG
jgi:RNA polymerase sigma-70 factor (ECF subfamily)